MTRRARVLVDRAMYRVYSRVSRREGIFPQEGEPEALRDLLGEVKRRDGMEALALGVPDGCLYKKSRGFE
ncbi:MAG: hypothetical protein V1750_11330 [Acidobacteriota bacterium]